MNQTGTGTRMLKAWGLLGIGCAALIGAAVALHRQHMILSTALSAVSMFWIVWSLVLWPWNRAE